MKWANIMGQKLKFLISAWANNLHNHFEKFTKVTTSFGISLTYFIKTVISMNNFKFVFPMGCISSYSYGYINYDKLCGYEAQFY